MIGGSSDESPCRTCHFRHCLPFCRSGCGWIAEYQERAKSRQKETTGEDLRTGHKVFMPEAGY